MRPGEILGLLLLVGCRVPEIPEVPWAKAANVYQEMSRIRAELLATGALAQRWSPSAVVTVLDGDRVADPATSLVRAANQVWQMASGGPPSLALRVVLYAAPDSGRSGWRFEWFSAAVLPERTDGRTCLVLVPQGAPWLNGTGPALNRAFARAAAPCLYWARFGAPGRAMAQWLAETGYDALRSGDGFLGYTDSRPVAPALTWRNPLIEDIGHPSRSLEVARAVWAGLAQNDLPPYLTLDLTACLAGRVDSCARAVVEPRGTDAAVTPGLVRTSVGGYWWGGEGDVDRGPWVAGLIRRFGEDRFAQWWRTEDDLAAGFERAYGKPLNAAVRDDMERDWAYATLAGSVRLGPTLDLGGSIATLGWAALLLLLSLLSASRRVMGR